MNASTKTEKLRLIEFMGVLSGLIGVIAALGPSFIVFPTEFPIRQAFIGYLIFFIALLLVNYSEVMLGKGFVPFRALIALFTLLVSFLFGGSILSMTLAVTPLDQYWQGILFYVFAVTFNILFIGLLPSLKALEGETWVRVLALQSIWKFEKRELSMNT